jgi:hypothetical protein
VQQRNDLVVRHAPAPDIEADLLNGDAPASQQEPLALPDVFVEDIHADSGSFAYSVAWSSNDFWATRAVFQMVFQEARSRILVNIA